VSFARIHFDGFLTISAAKNDRGGRIAADDFSDSRDGQSPMASKHFCGDVSFAAWHGKQQAAGSLGVEKELDSHRVLASLDAKQVA